MVNSKPHGGEVNLDKECNFPPHEKISANYRESGETSRNLIELLPLQDTHADELYSTIGGETNAALYDYMSYGPFFDLDSFRAHIKHYTNTKDPQFYTIVDTETGKFVGHISFLRIDVPNRVIEIGHVLFSKSLQRTAQATEAVFLLANKAFEHGYRRLEWKCDSENAASRRAAIRFGFTFEGIFRQHMIRKGYNRDTAWYSIIDGDWRNRRSAFESWLRCENFNEDGTQRNTLGHYMMVSSIGDDEFR